MCGSNASGKFIIEKDDKIFFSSSDRDEPVIVKCNDNRIRVGCHSLTRKAWECLKRIVDRQEIMK